MEKIKGIVERSQRGFCSTDIHDLESYLTNLIKESLKAFKENIASLWSEDGPICETIDEIVQALEDYEKPVENIYEKDLAAAPNDQAVLAKYLSAEKEIRMWQHDRLKYGLRLLGELLPDLQA